MNYLTAPFPWFGGKSTVADIIWQRFGDVRNYVEPFYGSGAVLLGRPLPFAGSETINDKDGYVANFWRAVKDDPEAVAKWADNPVNENDLHARHSWLVERKAGFSAQLDGNPDFFDAKVAGWWAWGICCWIGSGWCSGDGPWQSVEMEDGTRQLVHLGNAGRGVNRQLVHLGNAGRGVNRKRVHLGNAENETGILEVANENGIIGWMLALAERLKRVRVCCGDWARVCGGKSGDSLRHFFASGDLCAVFLDPPYAEEAGRQDNLYSEDDLAISHDVRAWALKHGGDKRLRICLCGYSGEGHEPLLDHGWTATAWKANGGFANQNKDGQGQANCRKEMLFFSPHCLQDGRAIQGGLFDANQECQRNDDEAECPE